jgi:hypothetical protein
MKTAELQDRALDWAVAQAQGLAWALAKNNAGGLSYDAGLHGNLFADNIDLPGRYRRYNPSTNWVQGGPIIEREGIAFYTADSYQDEYGKFTSIKSARHPASMQHYEGPTPLIAAMRCYVASKLGDDVTVPEELT